MGKRTLFPGSLLFGLLSILLLVVPCWSQSVDLPGAVAYSKYKYGCFYISPGCCNSILAQDYDCLGRKKIQAGGSGCYNTRSGDWIIGTCGGGCLHSFCGGAPAKLCVIDQPNIGCGNCHVFLPPMPGSPPANCTLQVDPACAQRHGCGSPLGFSCYTLPFDGDSDLESGFLCDRRTEEQILLGCRPEAVLSCLRIDSFSADRETLNLSSGQGANLRATLRGTSESALRWTLSVAGRVFSGSGDSVSVLWDGKDAEGKQVVPGRYQVRLEARASGDICKAWDLRSLSLDVSAHDQPVSCAVDLQAPFGSLAHVASGNLYHSQALFSLPHSRFQGDFRVSYNSLTGLKTPLGSGWSHSFHIRLSPNNNGAYTLTEGDGTRTTLYRDGDRYTPQHAPYPFLTLNQDGTSILEKKAGIFYRFDGQGRITRVLDRNSNALTLSYDSSGRLIFVTDSSGRNISLVYNPENRVRLITDPHGNTHSFTYQGAFLSGISSEVQGLGTRTWAFTYDSRGFLLTRTDPLGYLTSYAYDSDSRVVQSTDPEGRTRALAYHPDTSTSQLTEKDGGVWTFRYDPGIGGLLHKTDPLGHTWTYAYDENRNLSSITDPRGFRTSFTHDRSGNVTSTIDALGNITTYAYNSLNLPTRIAYPDNAVANLAYDPKGNLTSATDPLGHQTRYSYDGKGNLLSILNPLGQLTALAYDSHGYPASVTDPAGAVTSFGYDSSGRLIRFADPLQNSVAFESNGPGMITRFTDLKGNTTAYAYDLNGNLTERTDAKGNRTSYRYNSGSQVTEIKNALNHLTRLAYGPSCPSCGDGADKLTSLTDPRGNTTVFEYDLAGRLVKETGPRGHSKAYTHDANGNLISRTDEKGDITLYSYDPLNRLTSIQYPNGDAITFGYDNRGNLTRAANRNLSYTFTHDLKNRIIRVLDSFGRSITYEYDALGKRTRLTTPDGRTISYQYDPANRLSEINHPIGTFVFVHDPAGRRTSLAYPNGIRTDYAYDPAGYLTSLTAGVPQASLISSFAYTHDPVGNRTSRTDLSGTHEYTYDPIDQLTKAVHPNRPEEQFRYDSVGNRQNTVVDSDNALLEDEEFIYTHDAGGNRVGKTHKATGQKTRYSYDSENRLVQVETPAVTIRYRYDPFGRRIEKEVNGQTTRYLYDGPNIVLETDGQNNIKSTYLHTLTVDDQLALEQDGRTYFYHKDGLGSIQALTDEAGQIVRRYEYAAFGEITDHGGTLDQPFTFTGRELDRILTQEETTSYILYSTELKAGVQDLQGIKGGGRIEITTPKQTEDLYYYRARYYDPKAGRFLSKDPIGFAGGDMNLYRIVGNNPINFVDPWGLWNEDVHSGIGNPDYGTYTWARQAGFSHQQATWIAIGNNSTDIGFASWFPIWGLQARHFNQLNSGMVGFADSRDFWAAVELSRAVDYFRRGNCKAAYGHLGKGLHSIQDKIAHRDWDTGLIGWNPHPDWYDIWHDPRNALTRDLTEKATKEYLFKFLMLTIQTQ